LVLNKNWHIWEKAAGLWKNKKNNKSFKMAKKN